MCGFTVYADPLLADLEIIKNSLKLNHRGPDESQMVKTDAGILYFHRLAIMDLSHEGMQPFQIGNSYLICNGEIYNEEHLKQQIIDYTFHSSSDCEVLLPLYKQYGTAMFKMLDAEYSLVLYDEEIQGLVAARDPLGIRPLFYGYLKTTKEISFASEAKALIQLCDKVEVFPPGHYYYKGEFVPYHLPWNDYRPHNDSMDVVLQNIKEKLENAVIKRLHSDASMGFLLSGGLDSSLVCSIAAKHLNKPIYTFAIGMDKDPIDLKYAKEVADYLGSIHTEVIMSKADVMNAIREVIYATETYDITTIRASIGMFLVSQAIRKHTNIKVLLTGEISDELFGYKYTDFAPNAAAFQKESEKRLREIHYYDVLRADRTLAAHSLEARVPFGDLDFVDYVMGIDPKLKLNTYNMGKYLLRKAFEGEYLPKDILYRDKAAFSDAVGHSLVEYIKEYAELLYTDEDFEKKRFNFKINTPFTKESLLYREIFENYYPDHAHLIPAFWMPNKEWEGCNVEDPSARVLKNYGKSGQ